MSHERWEERARASESVRALTWNLGRCVVTQLTAREKVQHWWEGQPLPWKPETVCVRVKGALQLLSNRKGLRCSAATM